MKSNSRLSGLGEALSIEIEDDDILDWRSSIRDGIKSNDIERIKTDGLLSTQVNMYWLAHHAESETVRYNATQFLLSQAGHGGIQKMEHKSYEGLPQDQLLALLKSRFEQVRKFNPNFDLSALLPDQKFFEIKPDDIISEEQVHASVDREDGFK